MTGTHGADPVGNFANANVNERERALWKSARPSLPIDPLARLTFKALNSTNRENQFRPPWWQFIPRK